jgi:hypothetical protein
VTRFKPGISIGAKAGYNSFADQDHAKSYFVGATLSPYKSYHLYWQIELLYNRYENESSALLSPMVFAPLNPPLLNNGTVIDAAFNQTSTSIKTTKNLIDVVPISLRYSITNYIGIGVGPQFSLAVSNVTETFRTKKYYQPIFDPTSPPTPGPEIESLGKSDTTKETSKAFEKMQSSVFGDVTFGFARIGPSAGIRYYLNFERDYNYWQFYAIWKF